MIAEGNLQQKKGCKLSTYQLILLSNAKKKKCACQLWLYYVLPELIMGKLWKFFFYYFFCVCVYVLANNNNQKHILFFPQKYFFYSQKVI